MERLVQSSVVLSDAAFGQSIQKIAFNTRKSFEHFQEAIDTCKAIFKSKSFDGKEKYYALLIMKEVMRVVQDSQFDYFVDKAAKRMKDFAIFNRKAPINQRGETCLEEFRKGTNKSWSQKFFELNLECWPNWVKQAQSFYESKKAKKLLGFAETIRDNGVVLPQTEIHFGLFKIDEQNRLENPQNQPAQPAVSLPAVNQPPAQMGTTSVVPAPHPVGAGNLSAPTAANQNHSSTPVAPQKASDAENKLLQQAKEVSVLLMENYNLVGASDTFEEYMQDIFYSLEYQDPSKTFTNALKNTALTVEGRKKLEGILRAVQATRQGFDAFSRGEQAFPNLKQILKQNAEDAKQLMAGGVNRPPTAYTPAATNYTPAPAIQPTGNQSSPWGQGFTQSQTSDAGAGWGRAEPPKQNKRAFEDDDDQDDGFIRIPAAETPAGDGDYIAATGLGNKKKEQPSDKDIWGEDSGDDAEDAKDDYMPANKSSQNEPKKGKPSMPQPQVLDDEGFDWGEVEKDEEPPARVIDWGVDTSEIPKPTPVINKAKPVIEPSLSHGTKSKPANAQIGENRITLPPASKHGSKVSFGVFPNELEESDVAEKDKVKMTEEEKIQLALKNQAILSKPESQQMLNNFLSQPDSKPEPPEDIFSRAKRLREAKATGSKEMKPPSKPEVANSQRNSIVTKQTTNQLNGSGVHSAAASRREPGSPGNSVQSLPLKPRPITAKNDSGLKEEDFSVDHMFGQHPSGGEVSRSLYIKQDEGFAADHEEANGFQFDPFAARNDTAADPNTQSKPAGNSDWFNRVQVGNNHQNEGGFQQLDQDEDQQDPFKSPAPMKPAEHGSNYQDPFAESPPFEARKNSQGIPTPKVVSKQSLNRHSGNMTFQNMDEPREASRGQNSEGLRQRTFGLEPSNSQQNLHENRTLNESDFFSAGIVEADNRMSRIRSGNLGLNYAVQQKGASKPGQQDQAGQSTTDTIELHLKVKELETTVGSLRDQLYETYQALVSAQAEARPNDPAGAASQMILLKQLEEQLELEKEERVIYEQKYKELNERIKHEREFSLNQSSLFDPKKLIELSRLNDSLAEEKRQLAHQLLDEKEKSRHMDFFKTELQKTKLELNELTKLHLAQTAELSRLHIDKAQLEESMLKELSVMHNINKHKEDVYIQTDEYKPEPPEWMKRVTELIDPKYQDIHQDLQHSATPEHLPTAGAASREQAHQVPHSTHEQAATKNGGNEVFLTPQPNQFSSETHYGRDSLPGFSPVGITINGHQTAPVPQAVSLNSSVNESFCQEFLTMFNTAIDTLASRNPGVSNRPSYHLPKEVHQPEPTRRPSEQYRNSQVSSDPYIMERFGTLYSAGQIPFPKHSRSGSDIRSRNGSTTPNYPGREWAPSHWSTTPRSAASNPGGEFPKPLYSPTSLGQWRH